MLLKKVFLKRNFNAKGFIGPIGDDLPSLVPIVVALILFFTIFSLTLNTFNEKNALIRENTELTSIQREMKGDSLLGSAKQFADRCDSIKLEKSPYSYMIAIYRSDKDISNAIADFAQAGAEGVTGDMPANFLYEDNLGGATAQKDYYFCRYKRAGGGEFSEKVRNYFLRFYPVAVMVLDNKGEPLIVPAVLAMVVWQ